MAPWSARLVLARSGIRLLVSDPETDRLKAVLPGSPAHPRAALTLLEGLALWSGHPLSAVLGAAPSWHPAYEADLFGHPLAPIDSALVRFEVAPTHKPRRARLSGLGDFRDVRQLPLWPGGRL